ncbi:formylglycine-generating enzyme family protein [Luteimonas pelagia]
MRQFATPWVLLFCLALAGGCGRDPADGAEDPVGGADTARAGAGRVSVGEDRPVEAWDAPEVEIAPEAAGEVLAEAREALEAGRLFGGPRDAIPLLLALREAAPDDAEVIETMDAARAALLAEGALALEADDRDPASVRRMHEVAAVARAIDAGHPEVQAYLERVDRADEVGAANLAGEGALAQGDVGEDGGGAIARFREALELDPGSERAAQGVRDAEQALVERAVASAREADFEAASAWLDRASAVRGDDGAQALAEGRRRVEAVRAALIRRHRSEGIAALASPGGLPEARRQLDAMLRIAAPGDPAAAELRRRIDQVAHYGLYRPGQAFTDAMRNGGRGPVMVVVPHGGFAMGAGPDERGATDVERPRHYVRFDRGFALSRHEVTVGEFRRFIEASGHQTRAERRGFSLVYDERRGNLVRRSGVDWRHDFAGETAAADLPVIHVSARDAEAYAAWLSEQTGEGYRLPSEAEFEYATRAGTETRFPWGDAGNPPPQAGNFTGGEDASPRGRNWRNAFQGYGDGFWGPAPVGSFAANAFGLHDLAGNVAEWVADCWHEGYRRAPTDGGAWVNPGCRTRVIRGGSWASSPVQTRSAWRLSADADTTNARLGFRLARGI